MRLANFRMLMISALCCVGMSACSYCWVSLNTAGALCHCDREVPVIYRIQQCETYEGQGRTWHRVKLMRAVDKGKGVFVRGEGKSYCLYERYELLPGSERIYYWGVSASCEPIIMSETEFLKLPNTEYSGKQHVTLPVCSREWPIAEVEAPVPGMTEPAPPNPALWRRVVAVPLEVVDLALTPAVSVADLACFIARGMVRDLVVKPLKWCFGEDEESEFKKTGG